MNERILHLKDALNAIYENANKLDIYNFNTAEIKELVNKYDTELNEYFEDSNKSGGVQFKRKKIINFSLLEKDIYSLHSKTFQYLSCLYIYETLDRIESEIDSYNEETYKYNADKCLFDLQKYITILPFLKNNDELNKRMHIIYKLIKLELKYKGNSNILNLIKSSELEVLVLEDLVEDDLFHKYHVENLADLRLLELNYKDNTYLHNDVILSIAIMEGTFLKDLIKIFNDYSLEQYNKSKDAKKLENIIYHNKNDLRFIIRKSHLYTSLLPCLLSISVLIGANYALHNYEKKYKDVPATTYEYYSTIDDSYNHTEIVHKYLNDANVNDTEVTIYYPCDERGTRIIKKYNFVSDLPIESIPEINYDKLQFVSSEYKYDQESIDISTDGFTLVKRISNIDYSDMQEITSIPVILINILANALICIIDYLIGASILQNDVYTLTIVVSHLGHVIDSIDQKRKEIRKYKEKLNIDKDKKELKKLNEEIKILDKNYEELMDRYSHLYPYLDKNGLIRKLK